MNVFNKYLIATRINFAFICLVTKINYKGSEVYYLKYSNK